MRKTTILLVFIFLLTAFYFHMRANSALLSYLTVRVAKLMEAPKLMVMRREPKPEIYAGRIGEEIIYDIKYKGIHIGTSRFNYVNKSSIDGKAVNVITFKTGVPRFRDLETIYSDPVTNLPLRIERDINKWPFKEKIIEAYDQKNFTVDITKDDGSKNKITRDGPIHNAILLPYFIRHVDNLEPGWFMTATFPTQQFLVTLVSVDDLETPAGIFKAYHFKSDPEKFEIWITADKRRIPVKIQGLGIFGYTMLMKEYK